MINDSVFGLFANTFGDDLLPAVRKKVLAILDFGESVAVGEIVAEKASRGRKAQLFSRRGYKRFSINLLPATENHRFQYGVESGSGPGSRWLRTVGS